MLLFKIAVVIMLIFFALGIACAVWLASSRGPGIGQRRVKHPRAADPYAFPIGEVAGFSREQLDEVVLATLRRIARDPLYRSLDLSSSAIAPSRNVAGGRHHPSMSAGRTSFANLLFTFMVVVFAPLGIALLGAWLLVVG